MGPGFPGCWPRFRLGFLGVVLGIIQVIGAILRGVVSERRPKRSAWSCAFFPLELFDFLLQRGDAEQGIAMATLPITDLLAEFEILASQRSTSASTQPLPGAEFSTGSINSGEEPLGQQICTSWPFMTNLVYRDGRDLGRGGFPFIHYRQPCTDGIGEALRLDGHKFFVGSKLLLSPCSSGYSPERRARGRTGP